MKLFSIGRTVGFFTTLGIATIAAYTAYDLYKIRQIVARADEDPMPHAPVEVSSSAEASFFPATEQAPLNEETTPDEEEPLHHYYRHCRKGNRGSLRKSASRRSLY